MEIHRGYHGVEEGSSPYGHDAPHVTERIKSFRATTADEIAIVRRFQKRYLEAWMILTTSCADHRAFLAVNPNDQESHQFYADNRWNLAYALTESGNHRGIEPTLADMVSHEIKDRKGTNYDAACFLSLSSANVLNDDTFAIPERETRSKHNADQAIRYLREALKEGWNRADHTRKDTDLDPIRKRSDFQEIQKQLDTVTKPGEVTTPRK